MKQFLVLLFTLTVIISLCCCSKTDLNSTAEVTLTFVYKEQNICVTLEEGEAENVVDILSGNSYAPEFSGVPSCGFDKNVSFTVGSSTFAIARDTCDYVQDLSNNRFFRIEAEDMKYIRSLFEKHGGYFPCV